MPLVAVLYRCSFLDLIGIMLLTRPVVLAHFISKSREVP